ncbi:BACON domain-containing protein [Persephonella sp.]
MKKIILSFILLFAFFFVSCGGGGGGSGKDSGGNNQDSDQPVISQNAILFNQETTDNIESIDKENKRITLKTKTSQISEVKTGSIIVIPMSNITPDGMLIKVSSITESGNKIVIQYEDAYLTELIEDGEINIPQTELTESDIDTIELEDETSDTNIKVLPGQISKQSSNLKFNISGNYNGAVSIRSSLNMSIGYNFKVKIKSFSLNYLRATAKASEEAKVIATAKAGANAKFKKRIGRIKFKPVTVWVGWVPVYVRPVLYFYIGGSANTQVVARSSIFQSLSYEAGIEYNGSWSPVGDLQKNFSFEPPSLEKASAEIKGYVEPQLVFWVYGTTGPYLGVDGYLLLKANGLADPWCELLGGVQGFTGAKLVIFSKKLANVRLNLFDVNTSLYKCQDPYLVVSPEGTLYSRGPEGGGFSPSSKTFTLSSSIDGKSVDYEVTTDVNWLDISNTKGTVSKSNPQDVIVSINQNANSLKEGIYTGKLNFKNLTNPDKFTQTREITLVVRKQTFTVYPDNDAPLLGSDYEGGSFSNLSQVDYQVGVDIGSVDWEITQHPSWITLSQTSGTVSENSPQTVTVSVNSSNASILPVGSHKGTIKFAAKDSNGNVVKEETRTVYLQVKMNISPLTGQQFDFPEGGSDTAQSTPWTYSVKAVNGNVNFEAFLTQNWLNINNTGINISDTASKGIQKDLLIYKETSNLQNLKKGKYTAQLKIVNTNSGSFVDEVVIPFTVNVVDPFNVFPSQLSFKGIVGGSVSPSSGKFTVSSDFDNIDIQISSDKNWVLINNPSITVSKSSPQDVNISLSSDVSNFPEGSYTANITFTKTNGGKQVQITKTVVLTIEKKQQAKLIWLGTLAQNPQSLLDKGISPDTIPTAMSSDASVVVGYGVNDNGKRRAFRWENGVMQDLGTFDGTTDTLNNNDSEAIDVSSDGSVVVGVALGTNSNGQKYNHAFRWLNGVMQDLGDLYLDGNVRSEAKNISGDGTIVVGWSYAPDKTLGTRAFIWENGTMQDLGTLGGCCSNANAISSNGKVVVGWASISNGDRHAFRWENGTMQDLGALSGTFSEATDVSSDGSVVVGFWASDFYSKKHAFRWENGTIQDLGDFGGGESKALGVSADGSIVVGWAKDSNGFIKPFIWTSTDGMKDLEVIYESLLTSCQDASYSYYDSLFKAIAVSPDGRYILGYGSHCGYIQPFIIDRGNSF